MEEHDGCKGCAYVSRGEHEAPCVKCTQNASDNYKRMTNADRIRAMSDEELAEFLGKYFTCEYECAATKAGCKHDCDGAIMEWLQSEVEVSDER